MSKLQAALAWAARGFPVFPLVPNGKEPIHDDWPSVASDDPATIVAMWTDPVLRTERDYNVGTLCTDRVVVDVDVKNGKDGHNEYMQLGGTYDTLVVRTPTGGYHCYFEGPDSANVSISNAVDIRSHNGFVVAPGSTIDGLAYEVVTDKPPQWIPIHVERLLRPPYERRDTSIHAPVDTPAAIEAGRRFAESAPPAIQGQRGDETTFVTAARMCRELALSVDAAWSILAELWNPRCVPPWQLDELRAKVQNAASYGTADMGRLDPSVTFATVSVSPPPSLFVQKALGFGNALDPLTLPPRPWMIDRLLMLHETSLILAPGSAGKSSLALAIAAHLAVGKDFGPYKTHVRCKSIVYNGEDSVVEQSRRLYAVCMVYNLPYSDVSANVLLLSADEIDLKLVASDGRRGTLNEAIVNQLIGVASNPDVGLIVYDPLVDIHDCDEADNPAMNYVMRVVQRVAKEANVASLVLHHTSKAGNSKQEERIGNMDVARGASGIVYKARIALTLMNASQSDCENYGFQDHERNAWVRLDDAKSNLTLASLDATWFHKVGAKLPNGDNVGALRYLDLKRNSGALRIRMAELLMDTMTVNGAASMTVSQAIAVLKAGEPLCSKKTDAELKKTLEGLYATPLDVRGRKLHAKREGVDGRGNLIIVME